MFSTHGAATVARRILNELGRNRRVLVLWAVFPVLMLVLFGLIYAGNSDTSASFSRTAPKILIGAALFFSCLGGPVATLVAERENGTLRRILLSPLPGASYFVGLVLAYLVVALGQTLLVLTVGLAFGARFHGSVLLGFAIVGLAVASYCGLGFFFGTHFARRTEDVTGPIAAFGVPLLVLGGTFFPIEILPPFLLSAAQANPVFHMNQALLKVGAEGAEAPLILRHILFLSLFSCASLLLGVRSYRRLLRVEQRG